MKNIFEIISAVPLFEGLPDEQLHEIKKIAVSRHYSKGETIFSEGDPGDGFYVIAEGLVKIYKVSSEGKEQILHIFRNRRTFRRSPGLYRSAFSGQCGSHCKEPASVFPKG